MYVRRLVYYFIFLVSLFFEVSCGTKKTEEGRTLSHAEMVSTLMDVYLAEQKASFITAQHDSSELLFKQLNAKVFASHNIQDSVFKKSFDYYLARPKELEAIYTTLLDSLNLRERKITSTTTEQ